MLCISFIKQYFIIDVTFQTMDLENTKSELSKLKREYEELQMDKNSMFNELSTHLKVVQKEYKELLESGIKTYYICIKCLKISCQNYIFCLVK